MRSQFPISVIIPMGLFNVVGSLQNLESAEAATRVAVSALDKAAEKGILHKNNAARRKSRLMKRLSALKQQAK